MFCRPFRALIQSSLWPLSWVFSRRSRQSYQEYNPIRVPKIEEPKLQKPKVDPHLQSAGERVKAAAEELERLGIANRAGNRIRKDLPKDMWEGTDRDFGG
jgi:hypothetical protein